MLAIPITNPHGARSGSSAMSLGLLWGSRGTSWSGPWASFGDPEARLGGVPATGPPPGARDWSRDEVPGNPGPGDPRTVYPGGRPGTPTICGLHYDTLNADARVPGLQGCRCKQRHPGRWTLAMARPGSSQHRASHSPIRAVNLVFTSDRPGP